MDVKGSTTAQDVREATARAFLTTTFCLLFLTIKYIVEGLLSALSKPDEQKQDVDKGKAVKNFNHPRWTRAHGNDLENVGADAR